MPTTCTPQSLYGPYYQTRFCGASVMNFTVTAGWNEQSSELSVNLVEDCSTTNARIQYDVNLDGSIVTDADEFSEPPVGCPVYFRVGDIIEDGAYSRNPEGGFEFSGLIQSWTRKMDVNGNPSYSVKITDPRIILDNSHIIVSDLGESVFVAPPDLNRGLLATPNVINVYAWLEALDADCRNAFGGYPEYIGDTPVGSLTGGFGGSGVNERGMRWNLLKDALGCLVAGVRVPGVTVWGVSTDPYSPHGRLLYRGAGNKSSETTPGKVLLPGCGVLGPGPLDDTGRYARYMVDLTEIPFSPDHYRITGPFISFSELITQVCAAAGCDYYIELLPLKTHELVIKVRVVKRRLQPKLGSIEEYVNAQDFVVSKTFGHELAGQSNSSFIFGAKRQDYVQQETGSVISDLNVIPHPGWDSEGNPQKVTYAAPYGVTSSWWWYLDFRQINRSLTTAFPSSFAWVSEAEMRVALGNYDTWVDWCILKDGASISPVGSWLVSLGIDQISGPIAGNNLKAWLNPAAGGGGSTSNALSYDARDAMAMYDFIRTFSEEYYGKKFLVKIPGVCRDYNYEQPSVNGYQGAPYFSDDPATDGGWPQVSSVLGLSKPSAQLDLFSADDGKILPILKFYSTTHKLITSDLEPGSFVADTSTNTVWTKAEMEEKWLVGYPYYLWNTENAWAQLTVPGMLTAQLSSTQTAIEDSRRAQATSQRHDSVLGHGISGEVGGVSKNNLYKGSVGFISAPGSLPVYAGVPLRSNTRCYGPWGNIALASVNNDLFTPEQAVAGNLHVENDESLSPWGYGSSALMNEAGESKVKLTTTEMQVVERGQVTVPGYPNKRIGSALNTTDTSSYDMFLTVQSLGVDDSFVFYKIDLTPPEGLASNAANISSVNVSVNPQGVQTEYALTTFTPVFGRFADANASRLKRVGQNALASSRARRAGQANRAALRGSVARARRRASALRTIGAGGRTPQSSMLWFCGKIITDGNVKRTEVVANDADAQSYYGDDYNTTAIMTMDGILRPVSKKGDGSLPAYAGTAPGCLKGFSVAPPPPGTVDGSKGYTEPLSIVNTGLDPLANPTGITPGSVAGRSASPNSGHDIDGVSRSTLSQTSSSNTGIIDIRFGDLGYKDDYRFMALRGPLVVHGWGYDLQGKPVPNSAGASTSYTSMTDQFADGWLQDPTTWPVAPVDLRFDRQRGVWTTPPSFRMYKVTSSEEIAAGATGNATVQNASDAANQGDGTIGINNITCSTVPADCNYLAYYDTATCEYWPIVAGSGGGSGTLGIIDEAYCAYIPEDSGVAATGSGGMCADISCLRLGWGIQVSGVTTDTPTLKAPWYLGSRSEENLTDLIQVSEGLATEPLGEDDCAKILKVSLSSECGATCSESNRDYCPPTGVQGFKWGEGFITIGEAGDPVPEIHKKLEFEETTGPKQKVGDVISHVDLGCGLKLDEGDEKCETSAKISITNEEDYHSLSSAWPIKVACGIKCSADGIEVTEKKIWISSCGLVLGTSAETDAITYGADVPCRSTNAQRTQTAIQTEPAP